MRFNLFGFPVTIEASALLIAGVIALVGVRDRWTVPEIALTVLIGAVSILVHELGHAVSARAFRLRPIEISLHGLGGATTHPYSGSSWKELGITVAGPLAGFGLALVALPAMFVLPASVQWVAETTFGLNVAWSVFNLLPIFPMDGGRALGFLLHGIVGPLLAWRVAHVVGAVLGGALAVYGLSTGDLWIGAVAGMFAWRNVERLQEISRVHTASRAFR
jgi:stage IV sporulation protein FB